MSCLWCQSQHNNLSHTDGKIVLKLKDAKDQFLGERLIAVTKAHIVYVVMIEH